jgi:hypothetical protein
LEKTCKGLFECINDLFTKSSFIILLFSISNVFYVEIRFYLLFFENCIIKIVFLKIASDVESE